MTRRAGIVLTFLFLLFFGLIVRITLLTVDDEVRSVGNSQGARTITVTEVRGTIYDRNRIPLVNVENEYFATFLPQERLLQSISSLVEISEYERLMQDLQNKTPLVARIKEPAAIQEGLRVYMAPRRYSTSTLAPHIIGYLDGAHIRGVYGVEKAFDSVLAQYSGHISVTYPSDGKGECVSDKNLRMENTVKRCSGGIVLSLDHSIQAAVEKVAQNNMNKGSVIVLDAQNGDILASASYPSFHPDSIAGSLDDADAALINRSLSLFDCGSVFKIVTALAALENGVPIDQTFECHGGMEVDRNTFHCHYRLGHQTLNMKQAFAHSCNLYFIQLAQQIGSKAIMKMAVNLGLTQSIYLGDSIDAPKAILPTLEDLSAPAALANFSFGQGELMVSPLHVARMTAAIAGDGYLPSIQLGLGAVDEKGLWTDSVVRGGETVLSAASIEAMQDMMESVVTDGTGMAAQTQRGTVAGKTGTAETGQVNQQIAVTHSWFTGYFPADHPQYVITILIEDHKYGTPNAAQLFCEIINNLP